MTHVTMRRPTRSRAKAINGAWGHLSLLRRLQYEAMFLSDLTGRVLDFGGGVKINYKSEVQRWQSRSSFSYEAANIDPKTEPHYLIEPAGRIPVEDNHFSAVISLNTFEHVYELDIALSEVARVLRSGGQFIFTVPFAFRVHGHPSDFHRGTANFWQRKLKEFDLEVQKIEALVWGPFSNAALISGLPGPFKRFRAIFAFNMDLLYTRLKYGRAAEIEGAQDEPLLNTPLGYFVRAVKR